MVLFIYVKEKKSKKVGNKGAGLIFCVNSVQGKRFKRGDGAVHKYINNLTRYEREGGGMLLYFHLRAERISLQGRGQKPLPFMAKNARSWFQEDTSWQKTTRHGSPNK